MLGGNYFKKKLEKKARKKEAKKARLEDSDPHNADSKARKARHRKGSSLKGPVVVYESPHEADAAGSAYRKNGNRGGSGSGSGNGSADRDSANERRHVPFAGGQDTMSSRKKRQRSEDLGGEHVRGATASSAAQRRRVLKHKKDDDLLDHFRSTLNASAFRLLNEQIYNAPTSFAAMLLKDAETFQDYHIGYRQQLVQWPVNPNQLIVDALLGDRRGRFTGNKGKKNMPGSIPPNWTIADMGCGDAQIAAALSARSYKVHSFDFCALNSHVTVANTSDVPLPDGSIDVCVFSLSLMATDYERSLFEAFRILKPNRLLKVVEVRSRIPSPRKFAELVEAIGFVTEYQDVVGEYFVAFDFLKKADQPEANRTLPHRPGDVLVPSRYKKR